MVKRQMYIFIGYQASIFPRIKRRRNAKQQKLEMCPDMLLSAGWRKLERIKAMPRTYITHTHISRHTHTLLQQKKRIPEHAGNATCEIKKETRGTFLERERKRQMLLKKLHLISIRAASPISSPYYSNLSDRRERSREKSNIPRPSTFNISSQDGRRAGGRAGGRTGKLNRKISREKHAGCVLHLQLSYSVMEN